MDISQADSKDTTIMYQQIFEQIDPDERKTKIVCTLGYVQFLIALFLSFIFMTDQPAGTLTIWLK